jgi:hypothetical protein
VAVARDDDRGARARRSISALETVTELKTVP